MKYFAVAALVGAISAVELKQTSAVAFSTLHESVEDAFVQLDAPCVYLDETQKELTYQLEMFSRTLDRRHWTNANNVATAMSKAGQNPKWYVSTWDLYDQAFSFPRVRRYAFVQDNMDMLEHFQDNLNTNISNGQNLENFLRVANTVRAALNAKYHDGEFTDPSGYDPKKDPNNKLYNP